jgi:hypothetical protein
VHGRQSERDLDERAVVGTIRAHWRTVALLPIVCEQRIDGPPHGGRDRQASRGREGLQAALDAAKVDGRAMT